MPKNSGIRAFGNFLKSLDVFGKKIEFELEGETRYKTFIGGILAFSLLVACGVSFVYFGRDMYERENPNSYTSKERLNTFPTTNITNKNFFFGVRIEDDNGGYITDPRFFQISFEYQYYEKNNVNKALESKRKENLPLKPCDSIYNKTFHGKTSADVNTFICTDLNSFDGIVGGEWTSDKLGLVTVYVKKCDSASESKLNIKCAKPDEYTSKYLNLFYVGFLYYNTYVNTSSKDYPVEPTLEYSFNSLDTSLRKQYRYYYSINEVIDDLGLVVKTSEPNVTSFNQFESFTSDSVSIKSDNINYEIGLYISNKQIKNIRSYIKIQGVTAQVGGILSFFHLCLGILYEFLIGTNLRHHMYKRLYNFKYYDAEKDRDFTLEPTKSEASKLESINLNPSPEEKPISEKEKERKNKFPYMSTKHESELKLNLDVLDTEVNPIKDTVEVKESNHEHVDEEKDSNHKEEENRDNVVEDYPKIERLGSKGFLRNLWGKVDTKSSPVNKPKKKLSWLRKTSRVLDIKKSKLKPLKYNIVDLWGFHMCFSKELHNKEIALRNQVFYFAQKDLATKLDILNLFRRIDQLNLLSSVVLEKDQEYMLLNSGRKIIYNEFPLINNDFDTIDTCIKSDKNKRLKAYLLNKKEEKRLEKIDLLLYKRLEEDIKKEINIENLASNEELEDIEDDIEKFLERLATEHHQLNEGENVANV